MFGKYAYIKSYSVFENTNLILKKDKQYRLFLHTGVNNDAYIISVSKITIWISFDMSMFYFKVREIRWFAMD